MADGAAGTNIDGGGGWARGTTQGLGLQELIIQECAETQQLIDQSSSRLAAELRQHLVHVAHCSVCEGD